MRKLISILVMVTMVLTVSGCFSSDKPESTVKEFIGAAKVFDVEKMESLINPSNSSEKEDIAELTKEEDGNEQYQKYFMEYLKENAGKIKYEVKDTEIDSNSAVVTVDFKYIDGAPILKATLTEYITKAFPLAFSGVEITDEDASQMFLTAMQEQRKTIEESYVEKTISIKCIKVDSKWYIDEVSDELLDVLMSNFISASEEWGDSMSGTFDESNEEINSVMEQAEKDNMTIIQKNIGDEIEFATLKLIVNSVDEQQIIHVEYGQPIVAKEGAKFIIVDLGITNITNSAFSFPPNSAIIVDDKGREFNAESDSMFNVDNTLDYRDLSPSIKETGILIYQIPTDAMSYDLVIAKDGTDELYKILLK